MPYKNTAQVLNVTLQKEITTELVKETLFSEAVTSNATKFLRKQLQ